MSVLDTHQSYPSKSYQPSKPFHLLHSDIWGPSRIPTLSRKRWFITFIDDHICLTWVYFLKEKGEFADVFKKFHALFNTQFNEQIRIFRSDNGRKYVYTFLGQFFLVRKALLIKFLVFKHLRKLELMREKTNIFLKSQEPYFLHTMFQNIFGVMHYYMRCF